MSEEGNPVAETYNIITFKTSIIDPELCTIYQVLGTGINIKISTYQIPVT